MHKKKIQWILNGAKVSGIWDEQETLLTILRREFHLWSVKSGCEQGECGSCTVLVNGNPVQACRWQSQDLDGCSVKTWEGIPPETRQLYSQGLAKAGMGCGFCVPGLLMHSHAKLSPDKTISRSGWLDILASHFCRCTGYASWLAALPSILDTANKQHPPTFSIASSSSSRTVSRFRHNTGTFHLLERLLAGEPYYVDDLAVPNMLEASIVWTPKAYGVMEQIDMSPVMEKEGVVAALLFDDILFAPAYQQIVNQSDTQEISLRLQGTSPGGSSPSFSMTAWQQELDPSVFLRTFNGLDTEAPGTARDKSLESAHPESKTLGDEYALPTADTLTRRESFVGLSSAEKWVSLPEHHLLGQQKTESPDEMAGDLGQIADTLAPSQPKDRDASVYSDFAEIWNREVRFLVAGDEVRWCGEMVGIVAAERREQAQQAAKHARIQMSTHGEPTLDIEYAFQREWGKDAASAVWKHGSVEDAFRDAAFVVSGSWCVPAVDAACLELPACLVVPVQDGKGCHIYTSGVSDILVKTLVSFAIHRTPEEVSVTLLPTGGHRGTRSLPWLEVAAARLAMTLKRPVKLVLSREEAIRLLPKRHAIRIHTSLACDEQGKLQGLRMHLLGDAGGLPVNARLVLQQALAHACGSYRIPAFSIEGQILCSNHPHAGQLHEDGIFQVHYALEATMDLLSQQTGIDGWLLRYRNVWQPGDVLPQGQVVESDCRMRESLDAIRDLFYKYESHAGIACAWLGCDEIHPDGTEVRVQLYLDDEGRCHIALPLAESGQGLYARVLEFVSQSLGLGVEQLVLDVSTELWSGQSRWSLHESHTWAVMQALQQATQQWSIAQKQQPIPRRVFVGSCRLSGSLEHTHGLESQPSWPLDNHISGERLPTYRTHSFAAQVVVLHPEYSSIQRIITACDVGLPNAPEIVLQQVEGAIHRGLGATLHEQIVTQEGMPTATQLSDLGCLSPGQMPHLQTILVTDPEHVTEEEKGVHDMAEKGGEHVAMMTVAPALVSALSRVKDKRSCQLPVKLSTVAPPSCEIKTPED